MKPTILRRRGITSTLAMIFLVLFATLAVGFYASTNSATQVSINDSRTTRALLAAESGMNFMRFELARVSIPSGTQADAVLNTVYNQLATQMEGTGNLNKAHLSSDSYAIYVPSDGYIPLDSGGSAFRAVCYYAGAGEIMVESHGKYGGTSLASGRGVRMNFKVSPQRSGILDYGVATRGIFNASSSYVKGFPDPARGRILSTATASSPVVMSGSASISGDVHMTNPNGTISGKGMIAGINDPSKWGDHVQVGVAPPEFPTIDPSPFVNYLKGKETIITSNQSGKVLSNIRVRAGTNVQFSGCTLYGVVLVEAPNKITFSSGSTNLTGVLVVDKPSEPSLTNSITFSGGGEIRGPENLPASYGELRTMTGSAILAPNFALTFSGGSTSMGGSVVCKNAVFSGGSGGVVDGTVIIMGTADLKLTGGSGFTIGNPKGGIPTGMIFGGGLVPIASTYEELTSNGF